MKNLYDTHTATISLYYTIIDTVRQSNDCLDMRRFICTLCCEYSEIVSKLIDKEDELSELCDQLNDLQYIPLVQETRQAVDTVRKLRNEYLQAQW